MFTYKINDDTELRILESRNADELFALIDENREHLFPWFPWIDTTTSPVDSEDFIRKELHRFGESTGVSAGIWHKGELAGTIGLYVNTVDNHGELAYWLGSRFEGKGLATASCNAILKHAFEAMELNRVQIRTATDNTRSRAVAERLGFTYEGTLRRIALIRDQPTDLDYRSMLKEEWTARQHNRQTE